MQRHRRGFWCPARARGGACPPLCERCLPHYDDRVKHSAFRFGASPRESPLAQLLAQALPHLPEVLAIHDTDGRYRVVSPRVRAVTGWRAVELLGQDPYEWIHPEDGAQLRRTLHPAVLSGASVEGRFRFRHRDGHYVWIACTAVPLMGGAGRAPHVDGILTLARDITAQLHAEQAAEEQSRHLALMQELAGLAWFVWDARSGQLRHNEAFVELTGQAVTVYPGVLSLRRLVVMADRPWLRHALRTLQRLPEGTPHTLEVRLQRSGGHQRWVRMVLALLRDPRPSADPHAPRANPLLLYGVLLDIDEIVRTREQTRRWLRAQELATARERQQVAHELHDEVGQILTGLRWQMEMAQRTAHDRPTGPADPSRLQEWIGAIDEAHRLLRQVAYRLRPPLAALGLPSAIRHLADEYAQRWLTQTTLTLELDPDLPDGDEWRVQQLLGILRECLNNVARHAHAQHVTVQARTVRPGWVTLCVEDDGVGLPTALMSGHAPRATPTEAPASLGLTSLQERSRLLDGRLLLESAPGRGTRITLHARIQESNDEPASQR